MGREKFTHTKTEKVQKNVNNDELSLYFIDGRVFVLIFIGTDINILFCATINMPTHAVSLGREEKMSTYTVQEKE